MPIAEVLMKPIRVSFKNEIAEMWSANIYYAMLDVDPN